MKIEIHIRDSYANGKKLGRRRLMLESCRVYKEAGDGLRLDNVAPVAYAFFKSACMVFLKDDPTDPESRMTIPTGDRLAKLTKGGVHEEL